MWRGLLGLEICIKILTCNHHEHPHDRVYREPLRLWVVHEYAKMSRGATVAIATWWSGGARVSLACTIENSGATPHGNPVWSVSSI